MTSESVWGDDHGECEDEGDGEGQVEGQHQVNFWDKGSVRLRISTRFSTCSEKDKGGVPGIGGKDQGKVQVQNVCEGYGQSQVIQKDEGQ